MKKQVIFLLLFVRPCAALVDIVTCSVFDMHVKRSVDVTQASHIGGGFFCELNGVINTLIYYEHEGIRSMHVDWTNEFFPYKDDPKGNGWDLYFEPVHIDTTTINLDEPPHYSGNVPVHELHDQLCVAPWLRYDDYLPYRQFVHEKINKHIQIKQHIWDQANLFYEQHMKKYICIGIHVRNALAHAAEAPMGHPSLQDYYLEIDTLLQQHRGEKVKIFIASDSHAVINAFKKKYGKKLLYLPAYRAQGDEDPGLIYENAAYWMSNPSRWHDAKPGYAGGLGALLDCLLLARCHYFIHITSNLATYVCFFNPHIKSIYLPKNVPFAHCRFRGDPSIYNKFLNPI